MCVTHCTDNSELFFEKTASCLLGQNYSHVFPSEISHSINNLIGSSFLKDRRITLQEWRLRDKKFHLTLAQNANYISIEIEWLDYEEHSLGFWIRELEMIRSTVHMINDPQKLIDRVLIGLRRVLGFERFIFFKASDDGRYEFMNEVLGPYLSSARDLSHSQSHPLLYEEGAGPKACLDFEKRHAKLFVSDKAQGKAEPVHELAALSIPTSLSYSYSVIEHDSLLENGVMSFAAFPIIIEGRVWGLFEGHHMSPHIAGRNMREAMALFSEFLSYQIRLIEMKR